MTEENFKNAVTSQKKKLKAVEIRLIGSVGILTFLVQVNDL